MDWVQTLALGIVQGLGEFLPISSSAHLILLPWFFQWQDPGLAFDVALHLGTLLAVLSYYHKIWWRFAVALWPFHGGSSDDQERAKRRNDRNLFFIVCAATIPAVIAGVLVKEQAESQFRNPLLIAATLAIMGIVLWLSDLLIKRRTKTIASISFMDAMLVGFAQCFALIPGFSRSGTTMTMALLLRFRREDAAHFSFLLSVPVTAGAVALELPGIIKRTLYTDPGFWIGIGSAGIVGFLAIAFLVRFVSKNSFLPFAVYRFLLAAAVVYTYFSRV